MKKIMSLIILSIFAVGLFNYTYATSTNLDKKLYKETIISSHIIRTQYSDGKKILKNIEQAFLKYRYDRDIEKATRLQNILKERIYNLSMKKSLTRNERKMLAIYKNMYYRTVLLLDYWLK